MLNSVLLKRDFGKFKKNQHIKATPDELKAAGLVKGTDYVLRGTFTGVQISDLATEAAPAQVPGDAAATQQADSNAPPVEEK